MIQPGELQTEAPYGPTRSRARDVWAVLVAAEAGNAPQLRELLARDAELVRAEYAYTPPLVFAVRGGHLEAVELLLEAGADAGVLGPESEDLASFALFHGHEQVAARVAAALAELQRTQVAPG